MANEKKGFNEEFDVNAVFNNKASNPLRSNSATSLASGSQNESWSNNETLALIGLMGSYNEKLTYALPGVRMKLWQQISKSMASIGYNKEPKYCEDKWKRLKNTYSRVKIHMLGSSEPANWAYFNSMDEILGSHGGPDIGTRLYANEKQYSSYKFNRPTSKGNPRNVSFSDEEERRRLALHDARQHDPNSPLTQPSTSFSRADEAAKRKKISDEYSEQIRDEDEYFNKKMKIYDTITDRVEDCLTNADPNPISIFGVVRELLDKKKAMMEMSRLQVRYFDDKISRLEEAEENYLRREKLYNQRIKQLIKALDISNKLEEKKIRALESYILIMDRPTNDK